MKRRFTLPRVLPSTALCWAGLVGQAFIVTGLAEASLPGSEAGQEVAQKGAVGVPEAGDRNPGLAALIDVMVLSSNAVTTAHGLRRSEVRAPSESQPFRSLRVTSFDLDDGLHSKSVRALAYGPRGELWVGTEGGVAIYNGSRFRSPAFTLASPSTGDGELPEEGSTMISRVASFHRDSLGDMWVTGQTGELHRYGVEEQLIQPVETGLNRIWAVTDAWNDDLADDGLWVFGDGLIRAATGQRFDPASPEILQVMTGADFPGLLVYTVCGLGAAHEDLQGEATDPKALLVGTNQGLFQWSPAAGLTQIDEDPRAGLFIDDAGRRWDARSNGDLWVDGVRLGAAGLPLYGLRQVIQVDARRHLLLGGSHALVVTLEDGRVDHAFIPYQGWIKVLLATPSGGLWLGTEPGGPVLLESPGYRPFSVADFDGLGTQDGHSPLLEHPWLKYLNGIQGWEDVTQAVGRRLGLTPAEGKRIAELATLAAPDGTGAVYVGSDEGLFYLAGDRVVAVGKRGSPVGALAAGLDGTMWVSRETGLQEYLDGIATGRAVVSGSTPFVALELAEDRLVGVAGNKVMAIALDDLTPVVLADFGEGSVRCLHVDGTGNVWIATYGQGLIRIDRDGSKSSWSVEDGLPDPFIGWMGNVPGTTEDTHLWMNTNSGVVAITVGSLEDQAAGLRRELEFHLLKSPEGNGVNGAALSTGHLILPTLQGVISIDTNEAIPVPAAPRLSIDRVVTGGEIVAAPTTLVGEVDLEFHYSVVAFPTTRAAHVEVRLDGHDDQWQGAGQARMARYTNLSPGSYQFRIRARSDGGPFGAELHGPVLAVQADWWKRSGTRILGALGLVLAVAVGIRTRTRSLVTRGRLLEAEVTKRRSVEEDLVMSRGEFKTVLETANDGIFSFDASGRIHYANAAIHGIFRLPPGSLVGESTGRFGIRELGDSRALKALREGLLEGDDARIHRTFGVRNDGEKFSAEISVTATHGGESGRAVCIVRDVTEQVAVEEDVERLRRQLARAEEAQRGHIARELHDDFSQRLMALALHLRTAQRAEAEPGGAPRVLRTLVDVQEGLEALGSDLHDLSRRLHPTVLDDLGLSVALRSECARRSALSQVPIDFLYSGPTCPLHPEVALALFRVAQEAMANALRHGGASVVTVVLAREGDELILMIEDNGSGFDPRAAGGPGIGLSSMRERVRMVDGSFELTSSQGEGTTVNVSIPWERAIAIDDDSDMSDDDLEQE